MTNDARVRLDSWQLTLSRLIYCREAYGRAFLISLRRCTFHVSNACKLIFTRYTFDEYIKNVIAFYIMIELRSGREDRIFPTKTTTLTFIPC